MPADKKIQVANSTCFNDNKYYPNYCITILKGQLAQTITSNSIVITSHKIAEATI